jgi:hypothetical protein
METLVLFLLVGLCLVIFTPIAEHLLQMGSNPVLLFVISIAVSILMLAL